MSPPTLVIYINNSYYKYHRLYADHVFEVNENSHLIVYWRKSDTGEEKVRAHFRNWDYFVIDTESDF